MAKNGGALPTYEELDQLRTEGGVPTLRFLHRLGIPRSTWYYWRDAHLHGRAVRHWPAPVVDAIEERAAEVAHRWSAWGHRKIWAMLRADGVRVSRSSVRRALKRRMLLQPARYQRERRELAAARREAFAEAPARRNRVWQTDFTEFETARKCPGFLTRDTVVLVSYQTSTALQLLTDGRRGPGCDPGAAHSPGSSPARAID